MSSRGVSQAHPRRRRRQERRDRRERRSAVAFVVGHAALQGCDDGQADFDGAQNLGELAA